MILKKFLIGFVTIFTAFVILNIGNTASANSGYCEPVYYGANGYSCRYSNSKWDYKVTKTAAQAVGGVMAKGWIGSLGGSYYQPGYRG